MSCALRVSRSATQGRRRLVRRGVPLRYPMAVRLASRCNERASFHPAAVPAERGLSVRLELRRRRDHEQANAREGAHVRLCASRVMYVMGYRSKTLNMVFETHARARAIQASLRHRHSFNDEVGHSRG